MKPFEFVLVLYIVFSFRLGKDAVVAIASFLFKMRLIDIGIHRGFQLMKHTV